MKCCSILVFILHIVSLSNCTSTSKSIVASLDAKWTHTPTLLEASEFIATRSNDQFWRFVDLTQDAHLHQSDLDIYNFILQAAGQLLSPISLNLLKFSLSLKYYSPVIEMFNQLSQELQAPDCAAFVDINGQKSCDAGDIVNLLKENSEYKPKVFDFDHIYPASENNSVVTVLYGALGSPEISNFHQELVKHAKDGKINYILRHYSPSKSTRKVTLSGYGVELAVKSTEYKAVDDSKVKEDGTGSGKVAQAEGDDEVEGFVFGKLRDLHPELQDQLKEFRMHLKESSNEMAPLKVWQLQDLSFQAAQRVMSVDPHDALTVLRDISQNLPTIARSLSKTIVKKEMRKEIISNHQEFSNQLNIEPGDCSLLINGLNLVVEEMDMFSLISLLSEEAESMDQLASLGIKADGLSSLLTMSVKPEQETNAVDLRHETVVFVNNLEMDRQYSHWPDQIHELLRPTFPGMLRYIAKNIFHLVFMVDPLSPSTHELLKTADDLYQNSIPARIGILLVVDAPKGTDSKAHAGVALARAFSYIKADHGEKKAFKFLLELYNSNPTKDPLTGEQVWSLFGSWYGNSESEDILGQDTDYDDYERLAKQFFDRTGLRNLPQVALNGVPIPKEELNNLEDAVVQEMMIQTSSIQHAVYRGKIYEHGSVYDYVMSQPNVVKRMNSMIQSSDRPTIDLSAQPPQDDLLETSEEFGKLDPRKMTALLAKTMKYFTKKGEDLTLKPITHWIVLDFDTVAVSLFRASLEQLKYSTISRVGIIHNPAVDPKDSSHSLLLARAVEAALSLKDHITPPVEDFIKQLIHEDRDQSKMQTDVDAIIEIAKGIKGLNADKIQKFLLDEGLFREKITSHRLFCQHAASLHPGQAAVITNGRVLGPLSASDMFNEVDFELLESQDMNVYARKISNKVDEMEFLGLSADDDTSEYRSNLIMKISSALMGRKRKSRQEVNIKNSKHSMLEVKPATENVLSYDVVAVVDPLSKGAQRLAPILMVLQNVASMNLRIFMNCKEKLSELPVNRFYRFVLEPELSFQDDGSLSPGPAALFLDIPESPILTMSLDTPLGWMVESVRSPYDLDNIKMSEVEKSVVGDFELEYILVEGHCSDQNTGQPPRGLQFNLGTSSQPEMFDTIVMANLGYFQLKAYPGSFILQLRQGPSADIYEFESVDGGDALDHGSKFSVIVNSFNNKFLKVKVKRKPGQEGADLLGESTESEGGIWESLSSFTMMGGGETKPAENGDETINIFSLASGHLYERLIRIMMLSVLKHTKSPVKFWFLKNYLSPTFKAFLPAMSKEYGFEYGLVQYQWPRWLHHQTEKQRIIWGYKILFLDVLFPLGLKKIIFVDADQIVRADLKELMDMDLGGAPYAYTPFCSSRKEMDGFRFWNQGYWRSHLGGRPYHISALYVVDLKRFRRMAAGDRLRGQYQGLSQDPNSLSNLDQDLPNNMIHQVPIKSLPQEWLWCETWCDDASKAYAKTIDLCNNPLTKEPKLKAAVRIAPEWTDYDNEIRRLQETLAAENISKYSKTTEETLHDSGKMTKEEL